MQQKENIKKMLEKLNIEINNINTIIDYLIEFPDIIDIIPKIITSVRKHIPNAKIILDFYIDPEIDDNHPIVYVRVKKYDDEFMKLLEKAKKEFIKDLVDKKGWILLTTDFVKSDE